MYDYIQHRPTIPHDYRILENGTLVYAMNKGSSRPCKLGNIVDKTYVTEGIVYKVSIGKKYAFLPSKQLAHTESCSAILSVGTRVVALYAGNGKSAVYLAGIIAEPPGMANKHRYLIFFDDGSTQYVGILKVCLVCDVSRDVADDVPADMRIFIRDYLEKYSVRLKFDFIDGQSVSVEWKGEWWDCSVACIDASLIQVYYNKTNQTEWIYIGSKRIKPLLTPSTSFKDITKRRQTSVHDGSNLSDEEMKDEKELEQEIGITKIRPKKIEFETEEIDFEMENEANKAIDLGNQLEKMENRIIPPNKTPESAPNEVSLSTNGKEVREYVKVHPPVNQTSTVGIPKKFIYRSTLKKTNSANERDNKYIYKYRQLTDVGTEFVTHDCTYLCTNDIPENIEELNNENPFLIPMFCGWQRIIVKEPKRSTRLILYRTPCGKRLRNIDEVHEYLLITLSELTIDLFTFDSQICCFVEFAPEKVSINIPDLSYGCEPAPLSCVNNISNLYPAHVNYTTKYLYAKDVHATLDPNFLVCCNCDNDCSDSENCACQQLTLESYQLVFSQTPDDFEIGYVGRRLMQQVVSGVYECNSKCTCSKRCVNRVVQNDVNLRLQVFKTDKCGWGVRCLHDIPQGCFISLFTGQILTDQKANKDGTQFGDEYLAELDYIEVCENAKEGYEKSVREPDFDETLDESNVESVRETDSDETSNESNVNFKKRGKKAWSTKEGTKTMKFPIRNRNLRVYVQCLHCCTPNVFVQSVFVDSHDLRFPWVAFFAKEYIRAGTELTWDYNYKVGSVPEKVLFCYCGSKDCRGRLL
uniref:Histone-lysine N-methyltransferase n=1 Tax=Strigamia maritima TaxID=126957 RepID=T1JK41_STRMM